MGRGILLVLPLVGVSVFALVMGFIVLSAARALPPASGAIPASLAFMAVGLLGGAVMQVVASLDRRIQELERRLRDREDPHA